jgi:hypothetical protein
VVCKEEINLHCEKLKALGLSDIVTQSGVKIKFKEFQMSEFDRYFQITYIL